MPGSADQDHINIWLAYSDLFSGLLIVAVALLAVFILPGERGGVDDDGSLKRREAQWRMTKDLFDRIGGLKKESGENAYHAEPGTLDQIKQRFDDRSGKYPFLVKFTDGKGDDAVVLYTPDGEEQRITFGSQLLFENRGVYLKKIKPEGEKLLRTIGSILLGQEAFYTEARVIGHTDAKPPEKSDDFEFNWILSSERAIRVVAFLLTDEGIGATLQNKLSYNHARSRRLRDLHLNFPPHLISAIGRGEFEPVDSNPSDTWVTRQGRINKSWDSESLMERNRRIEIIFRSSSQELPALFHPQASRTTETR